MAIMQELNVPIRSAFARVGAGRARDPGNPFLRLTGATRALAAGACLGERMGCFALTEHGHGSDLAVWKCVPGATAIITF